MNSSQAAGQERASSEEVRIFLRRIERLARYLLKGDYGGGGGLWGFQVDLLKLQQDIQGAIKEAKGRSRKDRVEGHLSGLQYARWNARRLGDSLAWLALGLNAQLIHPLAENSPVPIQQEGHATRGMIAVSVYLANQGWGFPLIHDVTDCLRIGDVTFVRGDGRGRKVRTVEIKTRFVGASESDPNELRYDVSVSFLSAGGEPDLEFSTTVEGGGISESPGVAEAARMPKREDRRIERQTHRMASALARQQAKHASVAEIEGRKVLTAVFDDSSSASYWKTLRRIIRKAHNEGYAGECTEDAFFYAAYYNPRGVDSEDLQDPRFIEGVMSSGLPSSANAARNSLEISAIPPEEGRDAQLFLPYFLYSIPKRAIFEILHGKLSIVAVSNMGRVADALEGNGFEVSIPSGKGSPRYAAVVSGEFLHEGAAYRFETNGIGRQVTQCIHELKGVDHIVNALEGMRESAVSGVLNGRDGG
ncbi:hypothetical protein ABZ853_29745 [Streptomyces albidoflavus]